MEADLEAELKPAPLNSDFLAVKIAWLIKHPVKFAQSTEQVERIHLVSYAKLGHPDPKMLVSEVNVGLDYPFAEFFTHIHTWGKSNEWFGPHDWFNDHLWWKTAINRLQPILDRLKRTQMLSRDEKLFIHRHCTKAVAMPQRYR